MRFRANCRRLSFAATWMNSRLCVHLLGGNEETSLRLRPNAQVFRNALHLFEPNGFADRCTGIGINWDKKAKKSLHRGAAGSWYVVAKGGIGGRACQLSNWLRRGKRKAEAASQEAKDGEAVLLGTTVRLTRRAVLQIARREMALDPVGARRFETWYVPIGRKRVAPKWLAGLIFDKPVSRARANRNPAEEILSLDISSH